MPGSGNLALFVKKPQHGQAPARIVRGTRIVPVLHGAVVGPLLRPVRAHGDEGVRGNAAVAALPGPHVIETQDVIRIPCHLLVHIDHDQGQQHVLQIDLIHGLQTLVEMRWRIDVGTPLPHVAELIDFESRLVDRVKRSDLHLAETLPMGRRRPEGVRQIDEALRGERRVDLVE